MKSAIAALAVTALIGSQALAQTTQTGAAGLLGSGKPAGVQEAQRRHTRVPLLLTVGVAALVAAGVIVAVNNSGDTDCGTACNITAVTTG